MENQHEPVQKNTESERPVTRRYNKRGKRRGKYAYAAPLGVLISLLSIVGVVALIFTGVSAIRKATDTSVLKEDIYYFLEPALVYTLAPFDSAATTEQDAFLNAAAYRVMQAEQIRMLREEDEICIYPVDDNGRIAVPVEEITASYQALFGDDALLTHRSIEDSGLEYSDSDACYYVPFETVNSGYHPVIDYIKRRSSTYEVRIGFVPNTDIRLDEHGNEIDPTPDMAAHFQIYTLHRHKDDGTYHIAACADE